ncbi:MAG: T9SS type A sorting domain-containing protein [candidate division Zixibacteria bacterium]|nr:T9SS type A sorting domain-containing protein [candidate division Zixibacteria bacterium]
MKRNCLVLIFLFMLLLTTSVFGALSGDVCVKFNGAANQIWYGSENNVEIWIANSNDVLGMSLGFAWTSTVTGFSWKNPYGNKPLGTGKNYIQEYNDAVNMMDNALKFGKFIVVSPGPPPDTVFTLPDSFLIGGAAVASGDGGFPLPANMTSRKCYDLILIMPPGSGANTFSVKPIFYPPAGAWKLDYGPATGFVMPTFCGNSTGSVPTAPTLPPGVIIGTDIVVKPCEVPTITGPGAQVLSSHTGYTFTFSATDGEPGKTFVAWGTDVGTIAGPKTAGVLTITPSPANQFCPPATTDVIVTASNTCELPNNVADYPFTITWTNAAPDIDCPLSPGQTVMFVPYTRAFTATDADPGDAASLIWVATSGDAIGTFGFVGNQFTYNPTGSGTHHFTITATDVCGAQDVCEFVVDVAAIRMNIVEIPKLGDDGVFVFQGTYTTVPVKMGLTLLYLAGYDLLIYYDASALSFVSATIGPTFAACPNGSGWEYFTYRFGANGNCGGPCPSGLLRLVALAETNNGPNHPGCPDAFGQLTKDPYVVSNTVLANLKFYVTNDRNYECQFTEIGFVWLECSDNAFSDRTGDSLHIAGDSAVHSFEWNKWDLDQKLIPCGPADSTYALLYGGFCPKVCQVNQNKPVYFDMFFMNGGIDIACANEIDARGDINLNGIANEIADAVLFTNFFLKGIVAFQIPCEPLVTPLQCSNRVQGRVAATDVNNDGHPLTVGDLVYLLRIIVGDALPIAKLSPFASSTTVNFANGSVTTESGSEIGAVYATFAINGAYNVASNTNMQVEFGEVNGELKVLVYSGMTNLTNRIASGTNELFTVGGDVELKGVEVADYYGNMLNTRVNKISLPTSFALSQNVPNPFNPTTKLGFALPNQTEWTLSIYNVAGQLVKNFSGNNIGNVSVEWDASMAPSGVYFYKLNAGSYSDTKKMVLMK